MEADLFGIDALFDGFLDLKEVHTRLVRGAGYHVERRVEDDRGDQGLARAATELLEEMPFLCREDSDDGTLG